MFHLLSDRTTHSYGHSILSDGFEAARRLKMKHPVLYDLLATLPVATHATGGSARFEPLVQRPILEHNQEGQLVCVRYNNDDRAPVGQGRLWQGTVDLSGEGMGSQEDKIIGFYLGIQPLFISAERDLLTTCGPALRRWEEEINDSHLLWEFGMQPGTPFSRAFSASTLFGDRLSMSSSI